MLRDLPPTGRRGSNDDSFMSAPGSFADHEPINNDTPVGLLDDVFGSAPPSPHASAHDNPDQLGVARAERLHDADPSDIPRLRSTHVTNGYREGIAASKEAHIQAGFDEGYSLGGEIGMKAGRCLGTLEGLLRLAARGELGEDDSLEAPWQDIDRRFGEAREDLQMGNLLSPQYFGPDGIWLFEVAGQDNEHDLQVTFADVAAAHPVIARWTAVCSDLLAKVRPRASRISETRTT